MSAKGTPRMTNQLNLMITKQQKSNPNGSSSNGIVTPVQEDL